MLHSLFRFFSKSPQQPSIIDGDKSRVVLYARVERPQAEAKASPPAPQSPPSPHHACLSNQAGHRERLLSMRLEHTRLCSKRRCDRFRTAGIITAGDLSLANPQSLSQNFGAPRKALRVIKQYRRAIRFAAAVPGMMPRDALLLISIHRRSVRGLASETPARLHRDLERFAESTSGRLQLRGRRIPSTRRLKRWISQCETRAMRSPLQARTA
jgi:hypothetical protein